MNSEHQLLLEDDGEFDNEYFAQISELLSSEVEEKKKRDSIEIRLNRKMARWGIIISMGVLFVILLGTVFGFGNVFLALFMGGLAIGSMWLILYALYLINGGSETM